MALIYVVEDDKNISEIESFALKNAGHQIVECASGKEFHKQVIERIPDLILLDIMLPDEDGLQILTKMRATPETRRVPVILVTAKTTEIDKVKGLDMGADDYLAKPFAMGELVARVKAMVRRNKEYQQTVLNLANVTLDLESNELSAKSGSLILSVKEAKLLALFLEKENVSYSKEEIVKRVFPGEVDTEEIALYIAYINNKLVQIHGNLQLVQEEEIIQLRKTA